MFNAGSQFYMTKGVQAEIAPRLVKEMIDSIMRMKKSVKVDYLQVFNIEQDGDTTRIEHTQEEPVHKKRLVFKGVPNKFEGKVYIIDDGPHITVLLSDEY